VYEDPHNVGTTHQEPEELKMTTLRELLPLPIQGVSEEKRLRMLNTHDEKHEKRKEHAKIIDSSK